MENASTISPAMAPCLRMNRMPCFMLARIVSVVLTGRKRTVSMAERNDRGEKRHARSARSTRSCPNLASAMAPSAGPTITAALNWMEFSAMALGMSSLSTSVGISAG